MRASLRTAMLVAFLTSPMDKALAQDASAEEKELGWASRVELSLVATSGNSEGLSFGLGARSSRTWAGALLTLEAGAHRAEETRIERRAVGLTPDNVVIEERSDSQPTAESAFLRGKYDRAISERLFWYGGAGWERDRFAGIDARWNLTAGVGNVWADREGYKSRTRYGVTWTSEEETSGLESDFVGLRFGWDLDRRLTPTTTLTSALTVDENLDDTSDYRAEELAAVAVAMSDRLALKVSAHLKYDHEPAFVAVPRFLPNGTPAGDSVLVQLDELDTILSVALVVSL